MKKKTIGTLLALMTLASVTSCGAKNDIAETAAKENDSTVVGTETELGAEDVPVEIEEPVYTDMEDLFLAENYLKVGREELEAVDMDSLEKKYDRYVLTDSVDLYNFEGTWVGYSKPNINVILFGTNDKWAEISFAKTILYVPRESFDLIAMVQVEETETEDVLLAEAEETAPEQEAPSAPKTEAETPVPASKPAEVPATPEPAAPEPETPVVDDTKYTPEEAVAIYRSIMEANGIQWNPELKNGGSWGTGWISLTKGQPEWAGNSSVESYRMGDSVGHSWNSYYLEITGSDENAVYITEWHN